jgi:SAM-dependent methyltransferase
VSDPARFARRCARRPCRACGASGLRPVVDLGQTPLADALLTAEALAHPEPRYPLEVAFCPACTLVQLLETVPPPTLFGPDYPYYSSFSDLILAHQRDNARELIAARGLGPRHLVVELASNDGYLLRHFVEHGIPVLGIDPAPGPARAAEAVGVTTRCEFFTLELARELVTRGIRADVVLANNVLAHVADTNGFVAGIALLLADDGLAVVEVPYVRDLVDKAEFDTIYHEHLCYFSATSLDRLLRRHGLFVSEVRRIPVHGGSLRLYVGKRPAVAESVHALLAEEARLGIDDYGYYRDFAGRVRATAQALRGLLADLKRNGCRLAAYGAAAKGATLLNYVGLGPETLDFVVDRNPHKHGRYMPGARLPIRDPEELLARMPQYVLLLAWNFRDEVLAQQREYRRRGGRFIVPIPAPEIIDEIGDGAHRPSPRSAGAPTGDRAR